MHFNKYEGIDLHYEMSCFGCWHSTLTHSSKGFITCVNMDEESHNEAFEALCLICPKIH